MNKIIEIPSLSHLPIAAKQFADALKASGATVVAFNGEMGAGKTTFIRALCHHLGVTNDMTNSPSFSIINEYAGTEGPIYHFDLYRLNSVEEGLDIGVEDFLYSGHLCLLEWPERISPLLPDDTATVEITLNPDLTRTLTFTPCR